MKVALGIIARPVESLLVLCLRPVISHFDGLIILTPPDAQWEHGVRSLVHEPRVFHFANDYPWQRDYAHARNTLIGLSERLGYDWLLMLDADESMLPDDLVSLRQYMETEESLIFSRFEFVDDFNHFCPSFYPDYQARAFKLNMGYNYTGPVHEYLRKCTDKPAFQMPYSTLLPNLHIFHYGKSKPSEEVWAKIDAYNQIASGHMPRTRPADVPLPESWALDKKKVRFLGNRPL
jgi:glycosyltransferase involved in cell wall biosynthesis